MELRYNIQIGGILKWLNIRLPKFLNFCITFFLKNTKDSGMATLVESILNQILHEIT